MEASRSTFNSFTSSQTSPIAKTGASVEDFSLALFGKLAESLGRIFVVIVPIGLIYGRFFRKHRWSAIATAIPIASILDAIAVTATGSVDTHALIIGACAVIVGIEIAGLLFKRKSEPRSAA